MGLAELRDLDLSESVFLEVLYLPFGMGALLYSRLDLVVRVVLTI